MKKTDPFARSLAMPVPGLVFHSEVTISMQSRTHAAAGMRPEPALP